MDPTANSPLTLALEKLSQSLPGWFGFQILQIESGRVLAEFAIQPQMLAPNDFLHAASVVMLADTAAGFGCLASLPKAAESFTTLELKSNFFGTARSGILECEATMVHGGRTTQIWDARVYRQDDERDIALFRCTQLILYAQT